MRHSNRVIAGIAAMSVLLLTAASAVAYSGQVAGSVSISVGATCGEVVTATATVLDADGVPVAGQAVDWSLVTVQSPLDKVNQTPTTTNAKGIATTTLTLATLNGTRRVRATVGAGTETEVSATAVVNPVCSGSLPNTSTLPPETPGGAVAAILAALALIACAGLTLRRLATPTR